ncbi:MAG TPA: hypothetical protein VHX19_00185 [Stellaceae bacterium]|jgi:hypothetical protein|nr:hypothetical protein [Stellaceae bacterium]
MTIGTVNYPAPVMVDGYMCKNCTDVDRAKAHIDPQHPNAGPYGVNANADPTLAGKQFNATTGAVTFGGSLGSASNSGSSSSSPTASSSPTPSSPRGGQVDLSV